MTSPFRRLLQKWFGVAPVGTCCGSRKQRAERPSSFRPVLDGLEDRVVPTSTWYYQVAGLGDSAGQYVGGSGTTTNDPFLFTTLRGAILNANTSHKGSDTITFAKALFTTSTLEGATTNGSTIVAGLSSTSTLSVGMTVTGHGIPVADTIATIGPNDGEIQLSAPATATGIATLAIVAQTITLDTADPTPEATLDPLSGSPGFPYNRGPSDFVINTNITIDGPSGDHGLTLNNVLGGSRLFDVDAQGTLTLDNLTLTGGDAVGPNGGANGGGGGAGMGGAIFNDGKLTLNACTLTGNRAIGGNGAAGWGNNGRLAQNGGAGSAGGGFVEGLHFTGGAGGAGGIPYINHTGNGGPGGAGLVGGFGSGGGGGGGGGGGSVDASGSAAYPGGTAGPGGPGGFGGGGGNGGGGGYNGGGGKQGDGSGGSGGFGGGNGGGGANIGGGGGAGMGGALFNNGDGTVTITNCTLAGNSAIGGSAGFASGGADGLGGAIFNVNGSITIYDSTISGNTAAQGGTGIYSLAYGSFTAHLYAYNSLIATAGSSTDFKVRGVKGGFSATNVLQGNNLVDVDTPFDPQLGPLANNGGPTKTMMPTLDSPAIGIGDTSLLPGDITTDQRGLLRLRGPQLDIGAFEIQHFDQTITFASPDTGEVHCGDAPFPVSASSSSGLPVTLSIVSGNQYASLSGDPIDGYTITLLHATPTDNVLTFEATQAGNAVYNAAAPVDQHLFIYLGFQSITFGPLANKTYGDAPFVVSASDSAGLRVTLSIVAGSQYALIGGSTGGTIALIGATPAGAVVTIAATQPGAFDFYGSAQPVGQSFTIAQATPTVTVTDNGGTYSGSPYAATAASVTGVGGEGTLASFGDSTLSYTYYAGTLTTAAQVSAATPLPGAPINVGSYTVVAHYTSDNPNYTNADSSPVNFAITRPSASITVTPYSVTYDGKSHTATGTATGIGGVNLSSDLTLSGTTHTNAGTYNVDAWSFRDPSGLYQDASGTVDDSIARANATVVVTPYAVTYDGQAHTAAITSITGVNGETGAAVGTVTLNTTHTSAANYANDSWSFTGAGNYNNIASTTISDSIAQATLTVTADTKIKTQGQANPTLTASYTGFVPGQTLATSGVSGNPSLSTSATLNSTEGAYAITAGLGTLASANYQLQLVNSILYVTSATSGLTSAQSVPVSSTGLPAVAAATGPSASSAQVSASASGFNGTLTVAEFNGAPNTGFATEQAPPSTSMCSHRREQPWGALRPSRSTSRTWRRTPACSGGMAAA
jgi:hypothetical protein